MKLTVFLHPDRYHYNFETAEGRNLKFRILDGAGIEQPLCKFWGPLIT